MKNKEKYETFNDAFDAFADQCYHKHSRDCISCPYSGVSGENNFCMPRWLYSEAIVTEPEDLDNNDTTNDNNDNNDNNGNNNNFNIDYTTEKPLSDQCRECCEILGCLSNTREKLNRKILDIIQLYDRWAYLIENYTITPDNLLDVHYVDYYHSYLDFNSRYIPIKWLDFELDEVEKIIESQKEKAKRDHAELEELHFLKTLVCRLF